MSVFEATPIPSWIVDPVTLEIASANEAAASRYGYSREGFEGLALRAFFKDADEDVFSKMALRESLSCLSQHVTYSGELVDVSLMCEPLTLEGRDMILVMAFDITDELRRDADLRYEEAHLRSLIDQSVDIIYETDLRGLFTFVNPAACRVLSCLPSELLGHHFSKLIRPDWRKRAREHYQGQMESGLQSTYFEFPCSNKNDGSEIWIGQHVQTVFRDGVVTGFQAVARDITDRITLEGALAETRDDALTSVRLKSEFLANMSHEIRTPMNGVMGMLGVLLDSNLDSDQRDIAETAKSSAESLLTILNDILDFSKMEASKLTFENADFDLRDSIESVIDLLADAARKKSIEIGCAIDADVPRSLNGDAGRLKQVLLNLVGNGIKFTKSGGVVVRVSRASDAEGTVQLLFNVTDTGIGISPETCKSLFQPFVQADASTTRRFGGTGLGLAISKQLVTMMQGEIGIESESGNGSTFWFTGTFGALPESALVSPSEKIRVLVVDDSATARNLMSLQLSAWEVSNDVAEDSRTAISMLRDAAVAGAPYKVVVSDLQMPDVDGITLARLVKAQPQFGNPRFIVVSGTAPTEAPASLLDKGIAVWLAKPIKQRALQAAVLGQAVKARAPRMLKPAAGPKAGRILVVEDNTVNQKVALRQLQKLGYSADAVGNGLEALDALRRIDYDLMLTDCHMPEMDGYQATAAIRSSEKPGRRLPIIALTASAQHEDRERCFAAGMDDFVTKPVREADLAAVLSKWLSEKPVADGGALEIPEALEGEDESFLQELFTIYVEQSDGIVESLVTGDEGSFERTVHALGGSSRNVGATRLADICRDAETEARKDPARSRSRHLAAIRGAYDEVRRELVSKSQHV